MMRHYIHIIYNVRARLWPMAWGMMFCVGCMTFASCSSDSDSPDDMSDNQLRLASVTRATDIDGDYTFQNGSKLWLALTSTQSSGTTVDSKGIYTLENTAWKGGVTVKEAKQYYIYGVMSPESIIDNNTCTITSGDFSEGATLTIKGQPTMVAEGLVPCVVVGVRGVTDRDDASTNWDVNEGSFGYMGILKKGQDNAQLLLDRLYAALFFSFTIDEDYGNLRTIKLKKMRMTAAAGTKATVDLTVRLEARSNGTSPIASVSATAVESAGALGSITMFDNSAGMDITDLTAEKQAVATNEGGKIKSACFAPGVADGLILTCVYNVYDKAGNDLGERTAVNSLSNVVTTGSLLHGQRRPIVLKVTPTYLYILSDEDLDNPTIKIQ